jgi:hypothetical protein
VRQRTATTSTRSAGASRPLTAGVFPENAERVRAYAGRLAVDRAVGSR